MRDIISFIKPYKSYLKPASRACFGLAFIISLTACDQATLDQNMAQARAVLARIQQGVAVTTSAIRQSVDLACANQDVVGVTYQTARGILMQQTGPNSIQNIDNLDRAMTAYTQVCAQASDPNASNLAALLNRAISAYAAFQRAKAKAGM